MERKEVIQNYAHEDLRETERNLPLGMGTSVTDVFSVFKVIVAAVQW